MLLTCVLCLGTTLSYTQVKTWTLKECIAYAFEHNITVAQSALNVSDALLSKSDALGSFLPTFNASASNTWIVGSAINPLTNTRGAGSTTSRTSSYGVNVGVTLFDGLQNIRQFQRAKLNEIRSRYQLEKSKDDIALLIANSYLQILVNKESLKVIEKQQEITKAQLLRTEELIAAGTLPKGDILDIKATYADEQTRIVQARNAVQLSLIALAQTLVLEDYKEFDIAVEEDLMLGTDILNVPVTEIIDKAKASRYEVQIAEQNRSIAQKDLAIARGAYYPTLNGIFAYNTQESGANRFTTSTDPNLATLQDVGVVSGTGQNVITQVPGTIMENPLPFFNQLSNNDGISYGIQVNVPIFNGFAVRNSVKRNKINVARMELQLAQAILDLESNVYQAYLDAKAAKEAYDAAIIAKEAQETAYAYAKDRYDVGFLHALDLNQSKFRLENAMSQEVQTKFDYIFKIKVLELYFGVSIDTLE